MSVKLFLKKQLQGTKILEWYYSLYPQRPLYVESLWQAICLSRWVVYTRLRARMLFFFVTKELSVASTAKGNAAGSDAHLAKVVSYNWSDYATHFSRRRSEHLIYLLRSIPAVGPECRVLSIGPKSEGEVLLFQAHGFKKVTAIDLFSYSPLVQVMDMHNMTFPDNSFNVICAAWVVRYSNDIKKCAMEMVRVCENGGFIAIAFAASSAETNVAYAIGVRLHGGIEELLSYFQPYVDHVYWKLEDHNTDESKVPEHTHSVVFRIKK